MENPGNYQETTFRDRPTTFGKDGKRVWLFPKMPKGKLYNIRRTIAWTLLIFFYLAPFIKLNGEPLIFLNFAERKFSLFGGTFYPQDFHLLVLTIIALVVFIVFFTVIYGRIFCGWACPQTIFMEFLYRPIEYLIDGNPEQQRKLAEQEMDAVKALKRVLKHSIFLVDTRMRIYRVNRTSEMVYGKAADMIGKKYTNILYGLEQPHSECVIQSCLKEARPLRREGPHPRWGGYYHFYAFPVLNPTGTLERVVYYEKDATEAKKLEQRLQQSDRLQALGTLAAGIAHEIRNPLATINFNAQMLQRELSLDTGQQQMFQDMVHEIRQIDRIVQQVLQFARPREPQFLPNQLNEVVRYCHDLARVNLRKANVEVMLDLAQDTPPLVMDFNQISQVVMNLILNAVEAMADGGRLTIKTECRKDPSTVVLELSDTGPGILEEDKNRIFDPFFTRKPEGTGLGLSISRQILEKHGAYIEVDSVLGKGTTFRVSFPLPSQQAV